MKLEKVGQLLGTNITANSQDVQGLAYKLDNLQAGFIFFTMKNEQLLIKEAIKKGAVAIVTEQPVASEIPVFVTSSTKKSLAKIAHHFYQKPSTRLNTVGIIGSSGKSTVAQLIHNISTRLQLKSQRLETSKPATSLEINKLLADAYENEVKNAIIETSLPRIQKNDMDYLDFNTLIHTTASEQLASDSKWMMLNPFIKLGEDQTAIINIDNALAPMLLDITTANIVSYGMDKRADIQAQNVAMSIAGTTFDLYCKEEFICQARTPYLGLYNVYNALATLAYFYREGHPLKVIASLLQDLPVLPGRFEKIETASNINVIVDHANTPDTVESVLKSLAVITSGRVIAVVSANHNRDRLQLSHLGKLALANSSHVIFTSGNPRSADPRRTIYDMLLTSAKDNYTICVDREKAILYALKMAKTNDSVILLGKSYDKGEIIDGRKADICNKKIAQYLIEKLEL